jgi:REP element-mobilizing transposase RayT
MARLLRIEYPGAVYHVMARGNRGRAIFKDDLDRQRWIKTLGEACAKTGWHVHAYVLMDNHYHFLVETPKANLVAGMKWMQGVYTQSYNIRHGMRGHLFQGRYKAVPVEAAIPGYLENASTFIHLNPARAGLIQIGREKLKSYRWSSYPLYLTLATRVPAWLERKRVMGALRLKPEERRGYELYLESRALELGVKADCDELEAQWKMLRRGWYVGSSRFAAQLRGQLRQLGRALQRESRGGAVKREQGEQAIRRRLREGLAALGIREKDLKQPPMVTAEKAALAGWLREGTTSSLRWLSEHLHMGHYSSAGRGSRQMTLGALRRFNQARAKLASLDANAGRE